MSFRSMNFQGSEMMSEYSKRNWYRKWRVDTAIHEAVSVARRMHFGPQFDELLKLVVSRSSLLLARPVGGYTGISEVERMLRGLLALTEQHRSWLRSPVDWAGAQGSPIRQFRDLANHLLAVRQVPDFMTLVWFEERSKKALAHHKLFKHIARGNSIRGASLPIALTPEAAEQVFNVPAHFSVAQAVRWCEVRGMGGDRALANTVVATRLGSSFKHGEFWSAALRVLVRQPQIEINMVEPIIEYLQHEYLRANTRFDQLIPGRRFNSFVRRVKKWMERSPLYRRAPLLTWRKTGIGGLRHVEAQSHCWSRRSFSIMELTDSRQLHEEGVDMHHCVATYAHACAKRLSSIWSMRSHGALESQRLLTIEVDPWRRMIVTALGRCNRRPTADAKRIMKLWADQQELRFGRGVLNG